MVRRKTGALTAVACELGAHYAGADKSVVASMHAYGESGGIAFQIIDDVLNFSASPVGASDRIYLLSEDGRTVVLKRGPRLDVLAVNSLDETFYASPAIVGNEIYLRGDKHLFCFSKSSEQ